MIIFSKVYYGGTIGGIGCFGHDFHDDDVFVCIDGVVQPSDGACGESRCRFEGCNCDSGDDGCRPRFSGAEWDADGIPLCGVDSERCSSCEQLVGLQQPVAVGPGNCVAGHWIHLLLDLHAMHCSRGDNIDFLGDYYGRGRSCVLCRSLPVLLLHVASGSYRISAGPHQPGHLLNMMSIFMTVWIISIFEP